MRPGEVVGLEVEPGRMEDVVVVTPLGSLPGGELLGQFERCCDGARILLFRSLEIVVGPW